MIYASLLDFRYLTMVDSDLADEIKKNERTTEMEDRWAQSRARSRKCWILNRYCTPFYTSYAEDDDYRFINRGARGRARGYVCRVK